MELGLAGKTALITGASGGIGQAITRGFAGEGARVAVHFHSNRQAADALVAETGGENSLATGADLRDEEAVAAAFRQAREKFGTLDILVANAGVWPSEPVPLHEMTTARWQATLENNLTSVFLCCREFVRQAVAARLEDPTIVITGSTAGIFGEAGHGDYAASKSPLMHGLLLTLKNELARVAPRGRVNAVCPGWVVTPMARKFVDDGESIRRALSTIALRKVAGPDDIANAILFLASSRVAGHITGQTLTVSGGMEGRRLYDDAELDVDRALPPR